MHQGLSIRGLVKEYAAPGGQRLRAVDGLDLSAAPGEVLAFLGPNGAGKTTSIKICCGLIQPDAGEVRVAGLSPVTQRSQALRHLGAVLEGNRNIYWDLTAEENLRYFARLRLVPGHALRPRVDELLETFGLADKRHTVGKNLSRGMQQKLAIACALVHAPQVVLLDEPTLGLDVQASRAVKERVVRMARDEGRTVVLTTHQLDVAQDLADRVAIINHGRLVAVDRVEGLLALFRREDYLLVTAGALGAAALDDLQTAGRVIPAVAGGGSNGDGHGGGEHRYHLTLRTGADLLGATEVLHRHGVRLLELTREEPDLEQAFLALTEEVRASA